MKHKLPTASDDDAQLFRQAIGTVRRLPAAPDTPTRPKPAAIARMYLRDEAEALIESRSTSAADAQINADEPLAYRRDDLSERNFRQLKRGQFSVQDEIDLHQLRTVQAESVLKQFLDEARREGLRCVRVIHGKGLRSESGPVLKAIVDRVLRHRSDVLAFASAPASQGGTGAALVLLHTNQNKGPTRRMIT